jgi:hypothetical protein
LSRDHVFAKALMQLRISSSTRAGHADRQTSFSIAFTS